MTAALDDNARSKLQAELSDIDGVLHVGFDAESPSVLIVRDPTHHQGPVELAIRNRLAGLDYVPANLHIRVTVPVAGGPRRRVRFESVERSEAHGRVTVTVRLEWDGHVHSGSATGDEGAAIELKTTAHATVDALQRLTGQDLALRIIGVKPIRAFDSDLVVASLIRAGAAHQHLVGAVVVSAGPLEGAALAVLSALNRVLGNTLHTSD